MPEGEDLLLAGGGAGGDRAMESAVQHGTAPFVTGLQAPGTRSNLAAATGAWRYGKRSAFPPSPHPRRRRTNVERRVTLTFHLVQKICQVNYASQHRGVVVEFDENHPWFNEKTTSSDDLRHLVQVSYVQNPHPRTWKQVKGPDMLYTKNAEWAYEREWR